MGYKKPRQVFSQEQEISLMNYFLQMSSMYFGYTPKDARHLAYECAVKFKVEVPVTWTQNKMAGKEWLTKFLARNPELSIRKPEATSLGRATSFYAENVKVYFEKLAGVMTKYNFTVSQIWNVDETGVSTVLKPNKIVAGKGKKNVGAMTSGERGTNVTVVTAVSASGNTIPPMFVFSRRKYKDHFINGGPPDYIGTSNPSGWVTDVEFLKFIQHFIKHVKPSKESPVLLVLDNHSSHLHVETLNVAKENGIVMLTFPPHCSHKLQPLDVSVFGPFKKYCAAAQDKWLKENPGNSLTIYHIPKIVANSLPLATTATNITNGFKKSGIYPFNSNIFTEEDFSPAFVTDRPEPAHVERQQLEQQPDTSDLTASSQPDASNSAVTSQPDENDSTVTGQLDATDSAATSQPDISHPTATSQSSTMAVVSTPVFSPEVVRPYPKAGPRKMSRAGRRKRKSAVLTDTPEKNALEEEQSKKKVKKVEKPKTKVTVTKKKKRVSKKILKSDSEEDEYNCLVCHEPFYKSIPGENWIQCQICKQWSHIKCVPNVGLTYVCINCDSD
ncbi:GSCOCG00006748001-RA-CDS [Cotesia congregata]|nr:GSCOCG00006748001-RA-CDS [Cotesia congregata]